MRFKKYNRYLRNIPMFSIATLISGCNSMVLMNPKGQIGLEQRSLILIALELMLIVVIPVIVMTFIFAIKYRESNTKSSYKPNWSHSNKIELIIWLIPILIIIFLANLTWQSSHTLNPSKPIISNTKPITIQVISLDWKWLFIYPAQEIATVNEIAFPVNVPIKFSITSNSVMNSFFIPQLGSQIYAMAGMNSTLYLIANKPGQYKGMSSNFSGRGFSSMKFTAVVKPDQASFNEWINNVKSSQESLNTIDAYEQLAAPSECNPVKYFSKVKSGLFQNVINKFMNKKMIMQPTKNKSIVNNINTIVGIKKLKTHKLTL